jgi:DICT domain-containing protein
MVTQVRRAFYREKYYRRRCQKLLHAIAVQKAHIELLEAEMNQQDDHYGKRNKEVKHEN